MTGKYDSPVYDEPRRWIERKREKKVSWEKIRNGGKESADDLREMLASNHEMNDWPVISIPEWLELAEQMEEYEKSQEEISLIGITSEDPDNEYTVPQATYSGWQMYKKKLLEKGWKEDSVKTLEEASVGILRRLKADTRESGPVKGLVIGHVQSGKTANMEALMEMSADYGWNMFVILSGTIENLRQQTLKRMLSDFNPGGNLTWMTVDNPNKHNPSPLYMDFRPESKMRYFTVCLKNTKRLRDLIDWINCDKATHGNMRMLIIDDEADQASISNTVKLDRKEEQERRGINKLIVNLVNDEHHKVEKTNGKALAVNYVMYTATPYANFLNESDGNSLYPREFIWTLKTPDEYIGPEQIFGSDEPGIATEDGLDIKRNVPEEDLKTIKEIYEGKNSIPPESMKRAICWFICSVAVMRYWNYRKPVSMLVHTSQKQDNHQAVADVISEWIVSHMNSDLIDLCHKEYEDETSALTREDWLEQIGNYGGQEESVRDYPAWDQIEEYVKEILALDLAHIRMDDDGDLIYHRGLHLVIDNCANNGIKNNEHVRLAYPDPDSPDRPDYATAFIIVGGSTMSRGLTIEGLVSTFFLRASCQADTLMQMGRWFGYRRGYELLPRIWLTEDTADKFRFLSRLETELRTDLKKYMFDQVTPAQYPPLLLETPKVSWLRLTSKKHMMNAEIAAMNYSGARPQTYIFERDPAIQRKNIELTEAFINSLDGDPKLAFEKNCIFWPHVGLDSVIGFLNGGFSFSRRTRVFDEIGSFCDWLRSIKATDNLNNWSVIVAGKDQAVQGTGTDEKKWNVRGWQIGKVNRSERRKSTDEYQKDYIDIGTLRSLKDSLADIPGRFYEGKEISKQEHVDEVRRSAGMDDIPTLVIYRIDKDSKVKGTSGAGSAKVRVDLESESDIIGLFISVPGNQINKNFVQKITVRMPDRDPMEDEDEN
ncbi:MAG: Z1 domain-containing protein [Clostridia bacterium]|nr:Z1 domain-containing protein [Clostridia bacterium]